MSLNNRCNAIPAGAEDDDSDDPEAIAAHLMRDASSVLNGLCMKVVEAALADNDYVPAFDDAFEMATLIKRARSDSCDSSSDTVKKRAVEGDVDTSFDDRHYTSVFDMESPGHAPASPTESYDTDHLRDVFSMGSDTTTTTGKEDDDSVIGEDSSEGEVKENNNVSDFEF